jgi:nucleotide-binding universal stress UspA family protein
MKEGSMKRILVALDFSPRAEGVFAAAREVAGWTGAKLVLLNVTGVPVEVPVDAYKMSPGSLVEVLEREAHKRLAEIAAADPSVVDKSVVRVGAPWRAVCDEARAEQADLVVIGSHGYGPLDRVLGTTAGRIVNHSDVSVMVVRPRQ